MTPFTRISIPSLVGVKRGAIDRPDLYLQRSAHASALLL
jgi:hypothetical protein